MKDNDSLSLIIGLLAICLALIGFMLPEFESITSFSYNDLTDKPDGLILHQLSLWQFAPLPLSASGTVSPNSLGATNVWVFPFVLYGNLTVNAIKLKTGAAINDCLYLGIFNMTGSRVWCSELLDPNGGWLNVTFWHSFTLIAGTYYWASTNAGSTSVTGAYNSGATTAVLPRWGYVSGGTSNGLMPESINVESITESNVMQNCFVLLSDWIT